MTPLVVLLDFDRCLADTDALFELYLEQLRAVDMQLAQELGMLRREVEETAGSFDVMQRVEHRISARDLEQLDARFVARARARDLLLPGARQVLQLLADRQIPHGIMTYGGVRWQTVKLAATGLLAVPHYITPQSGKGRLVASWQTEAGVLQLPAALGGLQAQRVALVDDKARELQGLPVAAQGYLYRPQHQSVLPSQQGEVSDAVRIVGSWAEFAAQDILA